MTILSSDIKFLASKVMTDDPEGGGGPVGTVIADGDSNAIFQDVTEFDRAGGAVSIRQLFLAVQTHDVETFMDANIIVSSPPNDANVSITLAKCAMFHRRTDIANAIENYLIKGTEWSGYLLENHVSGQRSVQIFQRPGAPVPTIGRTLAVIYSEDLPGERQQYVRVTRVESELRTFTYSSGGGFVDYPAMVVTCDLTDSLRSGFPGSPPERLYVRGSTKSVIRDTTVADAASYYGVVPLTIAAELGDVSVKAASVYSQLVPSARTETVALDQRPAAVRQLTLATSPRNVTVGAAPHTRRTRVGQENRGFSWVQILKPFPAPNTVVVSWMGLGVWQTLTDDGMGNLTGSGVGTINYANGSISLTLPSMPDVGTSIIYSWGEKSAYENQSGRAGFRAPEFAWATPQAPVKPGTVVVTWMSGGVLRTATDTGSGAFTSASGAGEIDYAAGKIYLRPTAMIEVGGEFQTSFEYSPAITQNFAGVSPDAGGFASLVLDAVPAPKSLKVQWITVRNVSASSGSSDIVSRNGSGLAPTTVAVSKPEITGNMVTVSTQYTMPGQNVDVRMLVAAPQTLGTYTWEIAATNLAGAGTDSSVVVQGGATTGTFEVAAYNGGTGSVASWIGGGSFSIQIAAGCPDLRFVLRIKNQALSTIAATYGIEVDAVGDKPAYAFPVVIPPPAIQTREPLQTGGQFANPYASSQVTMGMYVGGLSEEGDVVHVAVPPSFSPGFGAYYDPPESGAEVWTSAQLVYGKPLQSQLGTTTTYKVWR